MDNHNITLIGMAGVGKSTIGKRLAKALDMEFIDTDNLIEKKEMRIIPDIIEHDGEDAFKSIEKDCIISLNMKNSIISTGGSVIYDKDVMKHLRMISKIVYLHAEFDSIHKRIGSKNTRRLVTNGTNSLEELYNSRLPLYNKYADIIIDAEKDPKETVDDIIQKIKG